jgi:hypothetical protein
VPAIPRQVLDLQRDALLAAGVDARHLSTAHDHVEFAAS